MWRCPHIARDLQGFWRRCTYVCRKSQTHNRHSHEYVIPPFEDPDLPEYYRNSNDQDNRPFMVEVTHALGVLAGEQSISASALCSPSMRDFIVKIVEITTQYRDRNKQNVVDAERLVTHVNRRDVQQSILRAGRSAYIFLTEKMEDYKYVNIMIDAATVLTMRVVHSTLSNPFTGFAPVPLRCTTKDGPDWTIAEYTTEITTILAELASTHAFVPVAICHDRLAAQSTAVRDVLRQLREANGVGGLIVDVSCLNHITHNAFAATVKCREFSGMIRVIGDFTDVLRTREAVNILGRKCPLPPKTRWLYLTDTLTFMLSNRRRITEFLKMKLLNDSGRSEVTILTEDEMAEYRAETSLPSSVRDLFLVTQPFKQASLCFECEQSRLSDAIPIIRVFQKSVRHILHANLLRDRESYEFLRQLTAQFIARLKVFLPPETWACWALTREGRYQLRKKVAGYIVARDKVCDYSNPQLKHNEAAWTMKQQVAHAFLLVDESQEDHDWDDDMRRDRSRDDVTGEEEEQDGEQDAQDEVIYDLHDEMLARNDSSVRMESEEIEEPQDFRKELGALLGQSLERILDFDILDDAYSKALDVVARYFLTINAGARKEEAQRLFDCWLYDDFCAPGDLDRASDYDMWRNFAKFDRMKPLCDVALRLITVGTSEADVERLISAHRFLVHDRMTRLGADTLLARLRLRAKAITEKVIERRTNMGTL